MPWLLYSPRETDHLNIALLNGRIHAEPYEVNLLHSGYSNQDAPPRCYPREVRLRRAAPTLASLKYLHSRAKAVTKKPTLQQVMLLRSFVI